MGGIGLHSLLVRTSRSTRIRVLQLEAFDKPLLGSLGVRFPGDGLAGERRWAFDQVEHTVVQRRQPKKVLAVLSLPVGLAVTHDNPVADSADAQAAKRHGFGE